MALIFYPFFLHELQEDMLCVILLCLYGYKHNVVFLLLFNLIYLEEQKEIIIFVLESTANFYTKQQNAIALRK